MSRVSETEGCEFAGVAPNAGVGNWLAGGWQEENGLNKLWDVFCSAGSLGGNA